MGNDAKDPFEEAMAHLGLAPDRGEREEEPGAEDAELFQEAMERLEGPGDPLNREKGSTQQRTSVNSLRGLRRLVRKKVIQPGESLDLHQMTKEQALRATRSFLVRAQKQGHQLVKIVCGRGLHSTDGAVLPDALDGWLKREVAEHVTLVMIAPREDGGEGARYVLLRS